MVCHSRESVLFVQFTLSIFLIDHSSGNSSNDNEMMEKSVKPGRYPDVWCSLAFTHLKRQCSPNPSKVC